MFEIIAIIVALLAIAVAIVLALAASKPKTFRVERAAVIYAPAQAIFPLINDFHKWRRWSPWEDRDPALKRSYGGAESGPGAVYAWDGNRNVGSGRMEILDAASSKIRIKLDFLKPFEGHNIAEFSFSPRGGATEVVWAMYGPAPLMSRVMQVFIDLDRMIGRDFESGLARLRTAAET
jgi:hypothetical protein